MAILKSNQTKVIVTPKPSSSANWMYFKGNGHTNGRNSSYDHVGPQRYFYISCLDGGFDILPWKNGFSLVWQFIPIRQAAYYTTFFYSASQGTDFYDLLGTNGYVGCHPYPHSAQGDSSGADFTLHKWEISIDGGDYLSSLVQYGQKHTQAFRCQVNNISTGNSTLKFYTKINSATDFVSPLTYTHQGAYTNAPAHQYKAMVFGNCPWNGAHQHERLSGYIRRIKIFSGDVSDSDLIQESLSDELVTAAGRQHIWWAKVNPTSPDDLLSDYATQEGNKRRQGVWKDSGRCEIIADSALANHTPFKNAALTPAQNLTHLERG